MGACLAFIETYGLKNPSCWYPQIRRVTKSFAAPIGKATQVILIGDVVLLKNNRECVH